MQSLNLTLSNSCNLDCKHCILEKKDEKPNIEEMMKVLGELNTNYYVKINGGEPTIHQEALDAMYHLSKYGFELEVTTNGLFEGSEEHIKNVMNVLECIPILNIKFELGGLMFKDVKSICKWLHNAQDLCDKRARFSDRQFTGVVISITNQWVTESTSETANQIIRIMEVMDKVGFDCINFVPLYGIGKAKQYMVNEKQMDAFLHGLLQFHFSMQKFYDIQDYTIFDISHGIFFRCKNDQLAGNIFLDIHGKRRHACHFADTPECFGDLICELCHPNACRLVRGVMTKCIFLPCYYQMSKEIIDRIQRYVDEERTFDEL